MNEINAQNTHTQRVADLQAVIITDTDGVIVAKAEVNDLQGKMEEIETSRMISAVQQGIIKPFLFYFLCFFHFSNVHV